MKILLSALLMTLSFSSLAQSIGPRDIEPMLQQMQESGKITAQQAAITRQHMQKMKAEDWKAMETQANQAIERNPAAAKRINEEGIDSLNGSDFGINVP